MIEPVVQTYACPPHIKQRVKKKQQAEFRQQLKDFKASLKQSGDKSPTPSTSSTSSRSSSIFSLGSPKLGPVKAEPSKPGSPTKDAASRSSSIGSTSSTGSVLPRSPALVSPGSSSPSAFRFFKKLRTPPLSPDIPSFQLPPKALRMPEENKQLMRFCTVCASNNNRSMEAHKVLSEHGYNVESFGTGTNVRMPGPAIDKPQVYEFGTPYEKMYNELKSQNPKLYSSNGVLAMLDRNRHLKDHPQQWTSHGDVFDVVITCQEKCFDAVCMDLLHKGAKLCRPVHVVNVEIEDNPHEAKMGARAILEFVDMVAQSTDPDAEMLEILRKWQKTHQKYPSIYQLCYA